MSFSELDYHYMQRAIELAAMGRFTTSPNPNVGAVLVKDGEIIGEGYHRQAGGPHAEVFALRQAAGLARGATCYVTLEPCSHYGRTPPCALALIDAGVSRVVVAMLDPNPLVAGNGVKLLQAAGIQVETGLLQTEAAALNPGFLHKMQHQRPFVRLKIATSVDGCIALSNGQSKWLTGSAAREDVQLFRAQSCAILSTAHTILADDAILNVRSTAVTPLDNGEIRQPLRIILDSRGRLTGKEPIFAVGGDILLVHQTGLQLPAINSVNRKIERIELPLNTEQRFDLMELLKVLATKSINLLWVEAGSVLASQFWSQNLVDELVLYQAPMLLGQNATPMLRLPEFSSITETPRWQWQDVCKIGDDLRLIARLKGHE
ncbi:MAG: bifunctional diaminohydroxyphosphoribosylaminopyrimidine deaminase/5-amino-6-(5-phosphoribosylamino)uracil reductase RibD [Gammaproteobacteria bacterium]|nr:bifunctional diaminohydroxyphosphoribosylaminopyrimidine deaminase/5-amino-6-(5-phosphoribosylamino)uracil reductase RibD [Gammaproteobacteria bacterium]